jgi:tetratricopeptide (TPR) repeat protein
MPVVAILLMWWKGRKLTKDVVLGLIPFFLIGLGMAAVTVYMENFPGGTVQAIGPDWDIPWADRLLIGGRGFWFYIAKILVPIKLTFSYPRVTPLPWHWAFVVAALLVGIVAWVGRSVWGRGPFVAFAYYAATLFPALGFIMVYPFRYSFVADHFQYLSGLGIIALIVGSACNVLAGRTKSSQARPLSPGEPTPMPRGAVAGSVLAGALLIGCILASRLQANIYQSPRDLWTDTIAKNPASWMAHDNLAKALVDDAQDDWANAYVATLDGRLQDAEADRADEKDLYRQAFGHFQSSLNLRPENYIVHNGLGSCYLGLNSAADAEREFRLAIELNQKDSVSQQQPAPLTNLAHIFQSSGRWAESLPLVQQALALEGRPKVRDRDLAAAHERLAEYDMRYEAQNADKAGRHADADSFLAKAAEEYETALKPLAGDKRLRVALHRAEINFQLGRCYLGLRQDATANTRFSAAILDSPSGRNAEAFNEKGKLIVRHINEYPTRAQGIQGLQVALAYFKGALEINPNFAEAKHNIELTEEILATPATRPATQPTTRENGKR